MKTYYAIADVNGPISRRIEAADTDAAVRVLAEADRRAWIDEPATDAENDLGINGDGMGHEDFLESILIAGLRCVWNNEAYDDRLRGWEIWAQQE